MSDSDDEVPLAQRAKVAAVEPSPAMAPALKLEAKPVAKPIAPPPVKPVAVPAVKAEPKPAPAPATKPKPAAPVSKPSTTQPKPLAKAPPPSKVNKSRKDESEEEESSSSEEDSDDDEDVPLSQRKPLAKKAKVTAAPKAANGKGPDASKKRKAPSGKDDKKAAAKKKAKTTPTRRASSGGPSGDPNKSSGQKMWTTLSHCGVLFPPEYEPHGVRMLYDGKPVELTAEQEEVASMYAVMKETEYMNKPVFLKNFWEGFKEVLGKNHVIKSLEKCDFTPMYEWHMAEREKKKNVSKEEKERLKKEREEKEGKYKMATVDGRIEPVGNFRVEPPGLFRGRGEHPKMGKIKKRIYPRDITINIGEGEPTPEHPYPGQTWKEVKHDHSVTWLAYWKDTISAKDYKYVFLGANSTFKADSDLAKYEKARKLKELIGDIRRNYEADWTSSEKRRQQMGTALYFIDKLALRAGHEKDEDEADTVGCCTLKVENVEVLPEDKIKFDFLGKDSIRYENVVEVHPTVHKNIEKFRKVDQFGKRKNPGDQLFECFDAQDLNKEMKNFMDGLSVKVFRTYNASIVLDRLLHEVDEASATKSWTVDEIKAEYDKANKEVAILCNHQRSVPKAHDNQIAKIQEKLAALNSELEALEDELRAAKKNKGATDSLVNKIARKKEQIFKVELAARAKEDLKTVALGTSKINYMDPRISVAWCKRNEVPIEKIFNKSLLSKFMWALDVEPEYKF